MQLVVKVSLCTHNRKRNLPPADFFRAKPQANHDREHAVADRGEIVLHVHVAQMVAVRWGDRGPAGFYKNRHGACSALLVGWIEGRTVATRPELARHPPRC